jgi:mersacidin/lichenicidin family type 2 lantibiotic
MSNNNIIRAWKDPGYRNSLSAAEHAALPQNPAGAMELADAHLEHVRGGNRMIWTLGQWCTFLVCP